MGWMLNSFSKSLCICEILELKLEAIMKKKKDCENVIQTNDIREKFVKKRKYLLLISRTFYDRLKRYGLPLLIQTMKESLP